MPTANPQSVIRGWTGVSPPGRFGLCAASCPLSNCSSKRGSYGYVESPPLGQNRSTLDVAPDLPVVEGRAAAVSKPLGLAGLAPSPALAGGQICRTYSTRGRQRWHEADPRSKGPALIYNCLSLSRVCNPSKLKDRRWLTRGQEEEGGLEAWSRGILQSLWLATKGLIGSANPRKSRITAAKMLFSGLRTG